MKEMQIIDDDFAYKNAFLIWCKWFAIGRSTRHWHSRGRDIKNVIKKYPKSTIIAWNYHVLPYCAFLCKTRHSFTQFCKRSLLLFLLNNDLMCTFCLYDMYSHVMTRDSTIITNPIIFYQIEFRRKQFQLSHRLETTM